MGCPANSYCPSGDKPIACPANTVSVAYSTQLSDCKTALGASPPLPTLPTQPSFETAGPSYILPPHPPPSSHFLPN